jgi:calcineurin-like phosphoesterase family protein
VTIQNPSKKGHFKTHREEFNVSYLIELRIGTAKWKLKEITRRIGHEYHVRTEKVPHLTLYGPFSLKSNVHSKDLFQYLDSVLNNYSIIPFCIDGFEIKEGKRGWVLVYKIIPSDILRQLREEIIRSLPNITTPENDWDLDIKGYWNHITVSNHLRQNTAKNILERVQGHNRSVDKSLLEGFIEFLFGKKTVEEIHPPFINQEILRVTVLKNAMILGEYDLLTKNWLSRHEALNRFQWYNTLRQYRRINNLQLDSSQQDSNDTFVVGDTHFGHANIIHYCCRPFGFQNVAEMDRVLIDNWNRTVKPTDTLYFLGDLKKHRYNSFEHYWNQLNGNKILIRGNHDDFGEESRIINYNGLKFLLIHDPKKAPPDFDGWIIHGHEHNNRLREYPFINYEKRTINVGMELTDYKPVAMNEIVKRINTQNVSLIQ